MSNFSMMSIQVPIIRMPHGQGLDFPQYATPMSAGMDLVAAISGKQMLAPGARDSIKTGIAIGLPPGFEAQVRPRSGLAAQNGITVLNSPGTIDADYRGEIMVILYNTSKENFVISRGMRIAQLVVAPVARVFWQDAAALAETQRGTGGFGSTGV